MDGVSVDDVAAGLRPGATGDYGAITSDRRAQQEEAGALAGSRTDIARSFDGSSAVSRMAFVGMSLPGLPSRFKSGRVVISQTAGPIRSQSTYILQRPGLVPQYDKTMHRGPVVVGDGLYLTLCQLKVTVPANEHIGASLELWRDEVLAAIALVVTMLDDRIAQREVLEDLVVLDATGTQPVAMLDSYVRLRDFPPAKGFTPAQESGLAKLADWASDTQTPVHVAARWYLKATHAGPTLDAIVYLWIALEALVPPKGKGKSTDVAGVEQALTRAGADPATWSPTIGRCAGIRGAIVHQGEEQPLLLVEGFYALEAATRILLRHEVDLLEESWPPEVHATNLKSPFREIAEHLRNELRVTMRLVED